MTASAGSALEKLHAEYGGLVDFLTLYVREAHPGDTYPQPRTYEEKTQHARDFRQREGIAWPVLVDDLEGSFHRALDSKPNAVYLIDRDGRVAYRQLWAGDHAALRGAIEKLLAGTAQPLGERQSRLIPMMRGIGVMDETLRSAGPSARKNMRKAAPPVYGLALLAGLFRPLPPLGRALVAGGLALGTVALLGTLGVSLVRGARKRRSRRERMLTRIVTRGAPVLIATRKLRKRGGKALASGRESLRDMRGIKALRELRMSDLRDLAR